MLRESLSKWTYQVMRHIILTFAHDCFSSKMLLMVLTFPSFFVFQFNLSALFDKYLLVRKDPPVVIKLHSRSHGTLTCVAAQHVRAWPVLGAQIIVFPAHILFLQ